MKKRFKGYDEFTSLTLVEVSLFSSHSVIFKLNEVCMCVSQWIPLHSGSLLAS